jgi:hypothetical protein
MTWQFILHGVPVVTKVFQNILNSNFEVSNLSLSVCHITNVVATVQLIISHTVQTSFNV